MYLRGICVISACRPHFGEMVNVTSCNRTSPNSIIPGLNFLKVTNGLIFSKIEIHSTPISRGKLPEGKGGTPILDKTKAPDKKEPTQSPQNGIKKPPKGGNLKKGRFMSQLSVKIKPSKVIMIAVGVSTVYYVTHLVEDPITGKKKFHIFSKNQINQIADVQSKYFTKKYKNRIETSGGNYNRIERIINGIIRANNDLPGAKGERDWEVFLVIRDDVNNSFVLANRNIFVFSGLLETVQNDDQLAALFAHEMAHALLNHSAEVPTWLRRFVSILLLPFVAISGVLPGPTGVILYPVIKYLGVALLNRPMGKHLEIEADNLSMEMMSRACFDPRKAKEFWVNMVELKRKKRIGLLKAHPVYKNRYHNFDMLMPKAFNILAKYCAGSSHPFFR